MKIKAKKPIGKHNVYDIGLSGPHNFLIEGGVFASNCFNRSHSISYSFLTYITAYLKANYPVEFFCSLMTTRSKSLQPKLWAQKAPQYINEARQLGVQINAPSVNASDLEFTIRDNEIYFGLNAIRDVGKTAAKSIMAARAKTPFKDVFDFVTRVNTQKVNTKTFMSLTRAGAFDKMGYCRNELEEKCQSIYDYFKNVIEYQERILAIQERNSFNEEILPKIERRNELRKLVKRHRNLFEKNKRQISEMDFIKLETELQELEDMGLKKKVTLKPKELPEKPILSRAKQIELNFKQIVEQANYIGCYINTHPVELIPRECDKIDGLIKGQFANIAAVITNIKIIKTRKTNKKMAFLELDDSQTICEAVIFPYIYQRIEKMNLEVGSLITAKVKVESEDPIKLIINDITLYEG